VDPSYCASTSGESFTNLSSLEETPHKSLLWPSETLPRLHATRSCNLEDDMKVFSPLVEVQHITPSLDKLWNDREGSKYDQFGGKKASSIFPNPKFSISEGVDLNATFDWKLSSVTKQVFCVSLCYVVSKK